MESSGSAQCQGVGCLQHGINVRFVVKMRRYLVLHSERRKKDAAPQSL